VDGACC